MIVHNAVRGANIHDYFVASVHIHYTTFMVLLGSTTLLRVQFVVDIVAFAGSRYRLGFTRHLNVSC